MKSKEETLTVDRVYTVSGQKQEEDSKQTVDVRTFNNVPTCSVNMIGSLQKNLGNYDSAKVSVSVSVPTYLEEIDDAFEYAKAKVEQFLTPSLEEFVGILKSKGLVK